MTYQLTVKNKDLDSMLETRLSELETIKTTGTKTLTKGDNTTSQIGTIAGFSLLVFSLQAFAMPSQGQTNTSDYHSHCLLLGEVGEDTMEMRQNGWESETAIALLEATLITNEDEREFFYFLTEMAWKYPVGQSNTEKQRTISSFGVIVYDLCME